VADNLTKEQRSYAMSRIRSRGNSSTEQALITVMRKAGITGWRRKSGLRGNPDFVFPRFHTVVFVDGCDWHGCRKCCLGSKSNNEYWGPKIQGNAKRDRRNTKELRAAGWNVVRIWEHDLKTTPMKCIKKIMVAIGPDGG
jgi:DNA mismatch endonuclease (patch repair protein)